MQLSMTDFSNPTRKSFVFEKKSNKYTIWTENGSTHHMTEDEIDSHCLPLEEASSGRIELRKGIWHWSETIHSYD